MFHLESTTTRCLLFVFGFIGLIMASGCGSGEIQNFGGIEIESEARVNRVEIQIFLVDENGNSLIWNESIVSPEIGLSVVSVGEFKTNAKIYSMRQGEKNTLVYDGRLRDLRWTRLAGSPLRLMTGEIPDALISDDPNRDTSLGIITVTVETDKQGPFEDTLRNAIIY